MRMPLSPLAIPSIHVDQQLEVSGVPEVGRMASDDERVTLQAHAVAELVEQARVRRLDVRVLGPDAVLVDADDNFIAFGFEALEKYFNLSEEELQRHFLYKDFKMRLMQEVRARCLIVQSLRVFFRTWSVGS